jgi:hypothetical protein
MKKHKRQKYQCFNITQNKAFYQLYRLRCIEERSLTVFASTLVATFKENESADWGGGSLLHRTGSEQCVWKGNGPNGNPLTRCFLPGLCQGAPVTSRFIHPEHGTCNVCQNVGKPSFHHMT